MKVGGRDFDLSKPEIEARMEGEEPELIRKHMVAVNGQMYPPKQVLGHVTGWTRTSFTTNEAQRVLNRLGFDCAEAGGPMQFVADAVRESVHQVASDRFDQGHRRGFSAAAGIALSQIQGQLNIRRQQMKGAGLSPPEQAIYAQLDELKSEMEAQCDRYWAGSGVDWRPPKQVAKAVVLRTDERES